MNSQDSFRCGRTQIMQTLDNIERTKGAAEAKSAARASITEYIKSVEQTNYDYGTFCGAVDWLAAAEGLKQLQEA